MSSNVTNATEPLSLPFECPFSLDFDPYNTNKFPKSAIPTWTAVSIINGIVAPPTFSVNLLVIWTILEDEGLRSTSYNLLLAVLSLSDLLVGLLVQPVFICFTVCLIFEFQFVCSLTTAYVSLISICGGWSLVTMMVISLERYFAIERPLYYHSNNIAKKLLILTGFLWLFVPTLLWIGRLLLSNFYEIRQLPTAFVITASTAIAIFCLSKVFLTSCRQMKAIGAQQAAVQQQQEQHQHQTTNQRRIKEYKRSFTLLFVVVASVMCYLPGLAAKIVGVAKGQEWNNDFQYVSPHISVSFVHFQSLVNPLIVSLRLSYIRKGVIQKLFCNFH